MRWLGLLGRRQVVDTTDTRLPLGRRPPAAGAGSAHDTAALPESSSRTLTARGRSRSSSSSSPSGPAVGEEVQDQDQENQVSRRTQDQGKVSLLPCVQQDCLHAFS